MARAEKNQQDKERNKRQLLRVVHDIKERFHQFSDLSAFFSREISLVNNEGQQVNCYFQVAVQVSENRSELVLRIVNYQDQLQLPIQLEDYPYDDIAICTVFITKENGELSCSPNLEVGSSDESWKGLGIGSVMFDATEEMLNRVATVVMATMNSRELVVHQYDLSENRASSCLLKKRYGKPISDGYYKRIISN